MQDRKNKTAGQKVCGTTRNKDAVLTIKNVNQRNIDRKTKEYGFRFNIWQYFPGKNKSTLDDYAFEHPAIFPEQLAEDHILSWSNEGDVVFDPFLGSGTTAKMAILNKRHYLGFEISEEYFDIASRRLDEAESVMI